MDNLTHTLTGLALARAGLGRLDARATWVLLAAANAPDLDALAGLGGQTAYLDWHRHFTHSLAAIPVVAAVAVALVRWIGRKPLGWGRCWGVACAGVASHVLLDWLNVYGLRLLWPFSEAWYRLDWTSVVDTWTWIVLLLSVAAPALSRLVGSEIGEARRRSSGTGFAWAALLFLLAYHGGRGVLHERAVATLDAHIYRTRPPLRVAAFPDPFSPFHWRGWVETEIGQSLHRLNLLTRFDPDEGIDYGRPSTQEACRAAAATPAFRSFLAFAQFPFWTLAPRSGPEGGFEVRAFDWRFGTPQEPGFVATAWVDARNRVTAAEFSLSSAGPR